MVSQTTHHGKAVKQGQVKIKVKTQKKKKKPQTNRNQKRPRRLENKKEEMNDVDDDENDGDEDEDDRDDACLIQECNTAKMCPCGQNELKTDGDRLRAHKSDVPLADALFFQEQKTAMSWPSSTNFKQQCAPCEASLIQPVSAKYIFAAI
jgi:hypothetical protein